MPSSKSNHLLHIWIHRKTLREEMDIPISLFKDCWKVHLHKSACTNPQQHNCQKRMEIEQCRLKKAMKKKPHVKKTNNHRLIRTEFDLIFTISCFF